MRKLEVYRNGILAGILSEEDRKHYVFRYDDVYYNDDRMPAISLTLPKTNKEYLSEVIFPFFSNMVAEGTNLSIQSRYLKIDESDVLKLLAATAIVDSIGAVTFRSINE